MEEATQPVTRRELVQRAMPPLEAIQALSTIGGPPDEQHVAEHVAWTLACMSLSLPWNHRHRHAPRPWTPLPVGEEMDPLMAAWAETQLSAATLEVLVLLPTEPDRARRAAGFLMEDIPWTVGDLTQKREYIIQHTLAEAGVPDAFVTRALLPPGFDSYAQTREWAVEASSSG